MKTSEGGNVENAEFALGIDIGTSSVRALVYDARSNPVHGMQFQVPYAPDVSSDGAVTVGVDHLLQLTFGVLDEIAQRLTSAGVSITVVGVSCFWHSLIALDDQAEPLTPVLLWADTRPAVVIEELSERVDEVRLRRRTGAGLHPSYWPAKLVWLQQASPDVIQRAHGIVSFAEYLYWRLFQQFQVSLSMASGTGLLNISTGDWDAYACSLLPPGIVARLSPVGDDPLTRLRPEFERRWPALACATWYPAFGDGACSNVGAGGWQADRFVVTIGTSSAIRAITLQSVDPRRQTIDHAKASPALWNYRVDAQRGIVGGALSEGGNLIAWLEATLRLPPIDTAEREIAARPPDAGKLTVMPFIAGERSPDWIGSARAAVMGLNMNSGPLDILQAAMESVAYQLRIVFDALIESMGPPTTAVAAGAALRRSPAWTQILANVLNHPVVASDLTETSSRGAAALALQAHHGYEVSTLDPMFGTTYRPEPSELYEIARRRQQALYDAIIRA